MNPKPLLALKNLTLPVIIADAFCELGPDAASRTGITPTRQNGE